MSLVVCLSIVAGELKSALCCVKPSGDDDKVSIDGEMHRPAIFYLWVLFHSKVNSYDTDVHSGHGERVVGRNTLLSARPSGTQSSFIFLSE